MKNLICALVTLALVLLASPRTPRAQAGPQQSSGAYRMFLGAQEIGTETYVMSAEPDGTRRAEAELVFGVNRSKATTIAAPNRPVSFTVEAGGARLLAVEFTADGAKVTAAGQTPRELKTAATVILENAVWHHYNYLLAQYDAGRGGAQQFVAFLPSQATQFTLQLERVGTPTFTVGGRQVATEHYRATMGQGLSVELWADAARVPLLIRVPAQGVRVVHVGSEALAEAISPSAPAAPPATAANEAYTSEEVTFKNGDVTLAGTLTLPRRGAAPHPAAVIITGSGGQDRDGSNVLNLYRRIAEQLSASGVAVLRVDDRGMGKSVMPKMTSVSYRDLINDTRAAFDYVAARREIDPKRVALVGHSEGAQTALSIAAEDGRVGAVALLAGASRPVNHIVYEQALYMIALGEAIDPSDAMKLPQISRDLLKIFDDLKTQPAPARPAADKYAWFREHAASNPMELARRVRAPTLVLNGERDSQVLPYHALELAQALAAGGNRQVRLRIFPNLTHLFTPSALDKSVTGERSAEVSEEFLKTLATWLSGVFGAGGRGERVKG
ncbi:MAG TPA: alpha/beta fold hydrolase [Pyrinomonadaceae bacterium]